MFGCWRTFKTRPMKEKLTIENLTGYLPYELKMISISKGRGAYDKVEKRRLKKIEILKPSNIELLLFLNRKPILHPLSTIKKNMTAGMVKHMLNCNFDVVREIWDLKSKRISLNKITYETYIVILKNHIDYQDLIEEGLAVDVNTIKK